MRNSMFKFKFAFGSIYGLFCSVTAARRVYYTAKGLAEDKDVRDHPELAVPLVLCTGTLSFLFAPLVVFQEAIVKSHEKEKEKKRNSSITSIRLPGGSL